MRRMGVSWAIDRTLVAVAAKCAVEPQPGERGNKMQSARKLNRIGAMACIAVMLTGDG